MYLIIVICIFVFLAFESCTKHVQKQNQEGECNDTTLVKENNYEIDDEYVKSLIAEDQENRKLWSYKIQKSASSPLFYEAIGDEGLYLYRVDIHNNQTFAIMVEDANIGTCEDFIEWSSSSGIDGVGYESKGDYQIIDDNMVNVVFEKMWSNYCQTCDSCEEEFTYHIQCTHTYKLFNMEFERIKADTIVVMDERPLFCCNDSLMHCWGLL